MKQWNEIQPFQNYFEPTPYNVLVVIQSQLEMLNMILVKFSIKYDIVYTTARKLK